MIWQDVEVSWIAGIIFSKRGSGVEVKLQISEIHLQHQILETSQERLKNDN